MQKKCINDLALFGGPSVHREQASGSAYPSYSAGIFEWELLGRWAVDAGELSLDSFKNSMDFSGSQTGGLR